LYKYVVGCNILYLLDKSWKKRDAHIIALLADNEGERGIVSLTPPRVPYRVNWAGDSAVFMVSLNY
jgi:hypothetical protein